MNILGLFWKKKNPFAFFENSFMRLNEIHSIPRGLCKVERNKNSICSSNENTLFTLTIIYQFGVLTKDLHTLLILSFDEILSHNTSEVYSVTLIPKQKQM